MSKFDHKLDSSEEILEIQKKTRHFIMLAKYKKAYAFLLKEQKKYPKSYYIASMLATLNAEDSYVLSDKEMNRDFKSASNKLKKLLPYARGASTRLRTRNYNEYY